MGEKSYTIIPADGSIKYVGEGTDGFGKYSIK